jgi:hypothetical protein
MNKKKVMNYVLKAASVVGLNAQQQIECILEGAMICYRLGMRRKYALFLYVAARMSAENENFAVAHALVFFFIIIFYSNFFFFVLIFMFNWQINKLSNIN